MSLYNDNMSSLTPAQLVLLNILVTFVVSIATTIISIALLADTPLSVTQVVNNVNEYQRERIVDAELDTIREELLASVQVAFTRPEVAGVTDELPAATAEDFDEQIVAISHDGHVVFSDMLRAAASLEEKDYGDLYGDGGVYQVIHQDLAFLYAKDFQDFIFPGETRLGQDVVVYDADEKRVVRSYISRETSITVEGVQLGLQDIPDCFSGGFVFADDAMAGICTGKAQAVVSLDTILVPLINLADNEEEITTN